MSKIEITIQTVPIVGTTCATLECSMCGPLAVILASDAAQERQDHLRGHQVEYTKEKP